MLLIIGEKTSGFRVSGVSLERFTNRCQRRVKGLKATKFNQNKKAKNQEMKPGGGGGESTYIPSKWISHPKKLLSLRDQTLK